MTDAPLKVCHVTRPRGKRLRVGRAAGGGWASRSGIREVGESSKWPTPRHPDEAASPSHRPSRSFKRPPSIPQQKDAVKDALDDVGRVFEGLESTNVLGRDGRQGGQGGVQGGLGGGQIGLGAGLDLGNGLGLAGDGVHNVGNARLFALGLGRALGYLLEQCLGLGGRGGKGDILNGQLGLEMGLIGNKGPRRDCTAAPPHTLPQLAIQTIHPQSPYLHCQPIPTPARTRMRSTSFFAWSILARPRATASASARVPASLALYREAKPSRKDRYDLGVTCTERRRVVR